MIQSTLVVIFLTLGTFFMFVAAMGVFRLPDVYNQLHALTKAGTLALVNLLIAAILVLGSISVLMKAVLILAFQFITAPVSAHMISRVQHPHAWEGTVVDEIMGEPTAGLGEEEPGDTVLDEETDGKP
jgi:multicomponent Na+:H+ antiporter subunit G